MSDASTAAIKFALDTHTDGGMEFLRCWFHSDFESIRKEWPEAPEAVFIGADPLTPVDEYTKKVIERARDEYVDRNDDRIEIDLDAEVIKLEDAGLHRVQAWVLIKMPVWIAGYNMPGYMPDNEPAEFETFDEAKRYIIGMMKEFEEQDYDRIGELRRERREWPGDDWEDKNPVLAAELETLDDKATEYCHGAEQVNLCSSAFSHRLGDYVFWVTEGE